MLKCCSISSSFSAGIPWDCAIQFQKSIRILPALRRQESCRPVAHRHLHWRFFCCGLTEFHTGQHANHRQRKICFSKEVNEWNYCENHDKSLSQLNSQRPVSRCFERSEWTKRPSAIIFVIDEPNDINYDPGGGNVHSGENRSQEKKRWNEWIGIQHDDPNDPGMAGNSPVDISSQVNDLLQSTESSKNCSKANEDEVLGELSKLYESEGTVSDQINAKLAKRKKWEIQQTRELWKSDNYKSKSRNRIPKLETLRSFLTFALRILTVHNFMASLACARARAILKHGGFALIVSSVIWKMALAHQRARGPHLFFHLL